MESRRKRVAIIGSGGAGMTAAWALDPVHDVLLFERNPVLGGHAHTTPVERGGHMHYVDDGFAWFSDEMYPRYLRMLEIHGIGTRLVPLAASLTDTRLGRRSLVMPPIGGARFVRTVCNPRSLRQLLQLRKAIVAAEPLIADKVTEMTVEEFLVDLRVGEEFKQHFLLPFLSATWGSPWGEGTLQSSIYPLMKYPVKHKPEKIEYYYYHLVAQGCASYIARVADSLEHATIHLDAEIVDLDKQVDGGWTLRDSQGRSHEVDEVVCATGAGAAQSIFADVRGAEAARDALSGFTYYWARVATHSDASFLPPNRADWCVFNAMYDGESSDAHVWHGFATNQDVFASYIQDREPNDCHNISNFHLPLETPEHFRAQDRVAAIQGDEGLWFAGDWTQDIGSHEDAVCSAVDVCKRLAPESPNLALLLQPRESSPGQSLPERAN